MEAIDGGTPPSITRGGGRTRASQPSDNVLEESQPGAVGRERLNVERPLRARDAPPAELRTAGNRATMPAWPRVSVVIPTLNEEQNIPHVFGALPHRLYEVILVDGYSTDNTVELARFLRPDLLVVEQERPGKGDAMRCGFAAATGEVIVMLDADGSADPGEIPEFVAALVAGADFAKGSRFRPGGGSADITRLRGAGNRVLNGIVNVLFGTSYTDLCYGYNAFWRHCLDAMNVDCTGFEVETLINIRVARAGLLIEEVPSYERERIHGQSNLRTFRDGWRVLRTILRERARSLPAAEHPIPDEAVNRVAAELEAVPVESG
jgi:glycosyltransferase involved in cell wall biosynthesis